MPVDVSGAAPRFVGKPIKRKENRRFLTGRGRFVDDIVVPGMLHAAILRSPVARARLASIDVSAALELAGVHAVYLAGDINGLFRPLLNTTDPSWAFGVDVVLADGFASYVGDPIAIVLAEDRYIAEDALELIDVDYDLLEPVVSIDQAAGAAPCLPGRNSNLVHEMEIVLPGAEEALVGASHRVTGRIQQPRMMPTPMETRGIIVDPRDPARLEIHMTSQNPHQTRLYMAEMMGMSANAIRIIAPDVGGGFGQKFSCGRDYLATVGAARLAGCAVKWIEDRAEALIAGGFGRKERLTLTLGFDGEARMTAAHVVWEDNCGAEASSSPGVAQMIPMMITNAYDIPVLKAETRGWFTNTGPTIALRGPWAGETLIREATIEKAARRLGIDPLDLRRRSMIRSWPHMLPVGMEMDGLTPRECLDLAAEKIDYEAFRAEQVRARQEGRYLGIGFAVCIEPTALTQKESEVESCTLRMDQAGKVTATVSCTSQGHSIETTLAQVIADELGMDIADVTIQQGDTASADYGMGAGGSRQAVIGGGAAKLASGQLRDKILDIAGHLMQSRADELAMADGMIVSKRPGGASLPLSEVAAAAYVSPSGLPVGTVPGLTVHYSYATGALTFANAVHACMVEVDIDTGLVKLLRYIVAEDCGVLLNPAVVEGQVAGGLVQGISNILWETQTFDEDGTPGAATFKDYGLPLACDIPIVEFHHLCTPSNTPTGAKGVGEGGMIVGAPACYNAVMDALSPFGAEIEELPLSPSRILAAVAAGRRDRG